MKEILRYYVEDWGISIWDWITASVTICSFVVAVCAFIIARKTLKSQKQTEKNTMPVINMEIQEFLFGGLVLKLLDAHVKLAALWYLLNEKEFSYYPSEHILEKLKIDKNLIHVELFYDNFDNYTVVEGFVDMLNSYNINITILNEHLKSPKISNEMLYNEFYSLIHENNRIADKWAINMFSLFQYDKNKYVHLLQPLLDQVTFNEGDNLKLRYYDENEVYIRFLNTDIQKKKLLLFMENRTIEHMKEFSIYLINKQNPQ